MREDGSFAADRALDPDIFRAYDIRGVVGETLTERAVYLIGRAFAAESLAAGQDHVAVGGDGRASTGPLRGVLHRALNEGGVDVTDVGLVPTPLLYYATHVLGTATGIMITGSHNPPEYNGLKMMIGGVTLAEDRIQQLRQRIENAAFTTGSGSLHSAELLDHYTDRIAGGVTLDRPLKVAVDCGNGVAGLVAPRLLAALGCEVIPLFTEVDGTFPNHHPDPAEAANLVDVIDAVRTADADLGIAFDGDGDRLGVVTDEGEIVWPDRAMMLFSRDLISRNPGAKVVFDVKCSRHLPALIRDCGGEPIMWKTGHSHIKAKIRDSGALLGGEFSGHICFVERWFGFDDAIYSAARLVEILAADRRPASQVFADFPATVSTPEIKVRTSEARKFAIVEELAAGADFDGGDVNGIDGVRVDYPDGWGLVRPSNTSPNLSLRFEADDPVALDRIRGVFDAALAAIDTDLKFLGQR